MASRAQLPQGLKLILGGISTHQQSDQQLVTKRFAVYVSLRNEFIPLFDSCLGARKTNIFARDTKSSFMIF